MKKTAPREVEFKLDVQPSEAAAVRASLAEAFGPARAPDRLVSVYFDTDRLDLHAHDVTLRIRSSGDGNVQTIKAGAGLRVGLFDRTEWETSVSGCVPALAAAAGTPVAAILSDDQALSPCFETIVERTTWTVETGSSKIEIALDDALVAGRGRSLSFLELEFELKRGQPEDLFAMVAGLGDVSCLDIGVMAKSDRGFALIESGARDACKADAVSLNSSMTTVEAFQAIAHGCVRQFRLNGKILIDRRSPEALHQARVAMRRLRAALALFKDPIADDRIGPIKDRLKSVSRQLGEARDLDVYLRNQASPKAAPTVDGSEAAMRLAAVRERREEAYDAVLVTLRSAAFRHLMIELVAWIETGPWRAAKRHARPTAGNQSVGPFAAAVLDRRWRKVKRGGRHLARLSPPDRHRVRIAVKTLRHAADFFGSLAHGHKQRRRQTALVEALEALQTHLGELNDLHTAIALETAFAAQAGEAEVNIPGVARGTAEAHTHALLRKSAKAHGVFVDTSRFWRGWANRHV